MSGGKASDHQIELAQKKQQALELRKCGASYRAIANKLDCSIAAAHGYVADSLREVNSLAAQDAEELRSLEVERLDTAQLAIAAHVRTGDLATIDRWLKIAERRSKLLGLDAPIQQQIKFDVERQLEQTLAALSQRMNPDAFANLIDTLTALEVSSQLQTE